MALFSLIGSPARAHPLQAEPINHAYVFNFDQFNLPEDPDEHVIEGGYLLLAELNCTACHIAPKALQERLAPKQGPILSGVGSRLDADQLWLCNSPAAENRSATPPASSSKPSSQIGWRRPSASIQPRSRASSMRQRYHYNMG